jgi:tetratricopeptide (TPR) repeat protein
MNRYLCSIGPGLVALFLVGAAPSGNDALVREGNVAFDAEEYQEAVTLFERAEAGVLDPGLVAFNKAAALYRLGDYAEAVRHYRRCLEDATGPRRARALFDLGNSLMQQQAKGGSARLLLEAVRCYRVCLNLKETTDALRRDADYNLELARLLWIQAIARTSDSNPQDKQEDPDTPPADPRMSKFGQADQGADPSQGAEQGNAKADQQPGSQDKAAETRDKTPGQGNLPPLPDQDELIPLAPEETAAYLNRVAQRILRERQASRNVAAAAVGNVKDW